MVDVSIVRRARGREFEVEVAGFHALILHMTPTHQLGAWISEHPTVDLGDVLVPAIEIVHGEAGDSKVILATLTTPSLDHLRLTS